MNDIERAVTSIRSISDLPWVDANARWGASGVARADAQLLFDKKSRTRVDRTGRKRVLRSGGFKNLRYDISQSLRHIGQGILGRPDTLMTTLRGKSGYVAGLRDHWRMARFYILESNELNRPDGKVSGTTVYGIWVEEVQHAALWSPEIALAVADMLESADPDDPKALRVAELLNIQRERMRKPPKGGSKSS